MKSSGMVTSLVSLPVAIVAACIFACSGSPHSGVVPTLPQSNPTPAPTSTPGHTPTPSPTSTPSGGNVATYQGCNVFTAGDFYNAPVGGASVDPSSALYIASAAVVDNSGFYLSTGVEHANLANGSTPTHPVHAKVAYHQNEWNANPQWPWLASFKIEPLGDAHAIVLRTSDCRLFETFSTSFSGGTFSAYSGWSWDLSRPFVTLTSVLGTSSPSSMASGVSLFAGAVKSEEIQSGVIRHALNWAGTAHAFATWSFVTPASDTDGLAFSGGNPSFQLPYGAHLRLKASFNDSSFGPQAKAITTALKTYGMFLADTGSSNALYGIEAQDGSNHWNGGDLSALGSLHLTDFDVLTLPAIQRVAGH